MGLTTKDTYLMKC